MSQLLDFYMANLETDNNVSRFKAQYPNLAAAYFKRDLQGGSVVVTRANGTTYTQTGDFIRQSASTIDSGDGLNAINTRMAKRVAVGKNPDGSTKWEANSIYVAMMSNKEIKILDPSPVLGTTYASLYYKPTIVDWVQPDGSLDSSKPVVREIVGIGIFA
jgi:hypothetical protein